MHLVRFVMIFSCYISADLVADANAIAAAIPSVTTLAAWAVMFQPYM